MKNYSGLEYICIDIANNVGKQGTMLGDKDLFENRIQWVKDNYDNLESFIDVAETKYRYMKAVMALREVMAGVPTGHTVGLDAICSGISIMSAITGCLKGCKATGLISTGERPDAYSKVTAEMNVLLAKQGLHTEVSRSEAKQAVMTCGYGSTLKPIEIFGEDTPEHIAFQEACITVAPGAFGLMQELINAWQSGTLEHSWYLPDAFSVKVKVLQSEEKSIQIDELDGTSVTVYLTENKGSKTGVSLVANITHSIDAYVLRNMQRRCGYNVHETKAKLKIINDFLAFGSTYSSPVTDKLEEYIHLANATNMVDPVFATQITEFNVSNVPVYILKRLSDLLTRMLEHPRFDLLTVHDEFKAHPNHCNRVRYWYKEILAELADSTILDCIYTQVTGTRKKFRKAVPGIAKLIREAEYQLS